MATSDIVSELAAEYSDDGIVVVPRSDVVKAIKDRDEDASVAHETVREAFESVGWVYSKHLYYRPDALVGRAERLADSLRDAGRLVVAESEAVDRVADPTPRGSETGWKQSDAIETLRETVTDAGWVVERATKPYSNTTRERVFYYRPLPEAIAAEHPNGRGEFTTEDIFAWYLGQSVRNDERR